MKNDVYTRLKWAKWNLIASLVLVFVATVNFIAYVVIDNYPAWPSIVVNVLVFCMLVSVFANRHAMVKSRKR